MNLLNSLLQLGFTPHSHKEHFGCEIPYVDYLYKKGEKHVYVSLSNYDGKFVEAVYEEYLAPKNTRIKGKNNVPKQGEYSEFQKKGFEPVDIKLFRDENELIEYAKNV
jgi:hypothetical protein